MPARRSHDLPLTGLPAEQGRRYASRQAELRWLRGVRLTSAGRRWRVIVVMEGLRQHVDICVVALGKIGLPLAVQFADKGHRVIGADLNERVVELVNKGVEPFPGEAYLQEKLRPAPWTAGRLSATTDTAAAVAQCRAVVLVVPLFVDAEGHPDFASMDAATQSVARACNRARWSVMRPRCRSAPPATGGRRCWRRGPATRRARTSTWCSAPSGC